MNGKKEKKRRTGRKAQHEESSREPLRYAFIIDLPGADPETCSVVYQNAECYCMVAGVDGAEMGKRFAQELLEQGYQAIDLCGDFPAETAMQIREMADLAVSGDVTDTVDEMGAASGADTAEMAGTPGKEDGKPGEAKVIRKLGKGTATVSGAIGMAGEIEETKPFEEAGTAGEAQETKASEESKAIKKIRIGHIKYTLDGLIALDFTRAFGKCGIIIVAGGVEQPVEMLLKNDKRDVHIAFVGNIRQAKSAAQKMAGKQVDYIELSYWFDRMRLDSVVKAVDGKIAVGTCGDLAMRELVEYPLDEPVRVMMNAKGR